MIKLLNVVEMARLSSECGIVRRRVVNEQERRKNEELK
jgi:hypothetical protein